jgi:hypothetical protein
MDVVRFCSKPGGSCNIASHKNKSKVRLQGQCLHPCVPKKGFNQVRLEPSLPVAPVPPAETLDGLLPEQKLTALWQTHMNAHKASESLTGRNEFGQFGSEMDIPNLSENAAPNLPDLSNKDFKTPKKACIVPFMMKEEDEDCVEAVEIGTVLPLNVNLTDLAPLEGDSKTPDNRAMRRIVLEWDGVAEKFGTLKNRFVALEALTGRTKDDVVAQFEECNQHCMNWLGNKALLLASRIGQDGRPDQGETSVWESPNLLQDEAEHEKGEINMMALRRSQRGPQEKMWCLSPMKRLSQHVGVQEAPGKGRQKNNVGFNFILMHQCPQS